MFWVTYFVNQPYLFNFSNQSNKIYSLQKVKAYICYNKCSFHECMHWLANVYIIRLVSVCNETNVSLY